jgi:hypothetical protein
LICSGRRPFACTLLAAAALLVAPVSAAAAGEREVIGVAPLPPGASPAHAHLHDTVLEGPATPVMRAASAGARARAYATASGERVEVEVSGSYPPDSTADQALVDFLGSRLHGPELGSLGVYVGTPAEIAGICGGRQAVACYSVAEQRMYVPGETVHGIPVEYALTHEYGHHVASWRSNNPWNALDWGAKHWSSAMQVCTHVAQRRLFPGNQGRHYLRDPGEGFADGYAHLHYPGSPWQFAPILRPDQRAFDAIRRDVLQPWTGPRTRVVRGRLGPTRRSRSFRIQVRLDGDLSLRLAAPRGLQSEVEAIGPSTAAGRRIRGGGAFGIEWCRKERSETVTITVRRRSGSGPFALKVAWPG